MCLITQFYGMHVQVVVMTTSGIAKVYNLVWLKTVFEAYDCRGNEDKSKCPEITSGGLLRINVPILQDMHFLLL